ncbi:disease resistance protein Roq1 isoform X1 [Cryptomeria japonica]|uniref:disease resistance protein Roq1 isoform X1 n=1 Tax=Cryptomeria japonica TaxID=3369 RepID=UPI0027DA41F3|nr:disease resistance protein Roq1 isoform X1 [Cryptomeria japonica]
MASTSNFSCNTEREPGNASEEIVVSPSASTTISVGTLFSSCFNWCSPFLSLCSTRHHSTASQGIAPSPSDTNAAFEQVVPSASTSGRSTQMPDRKLPYDVFINHRGPDVKHTLAAALYKTLTGMGLRVFLDEEELEYGDFLPGEIEEAMRGALLHIAIFSKNYAQSSWCLAELSFMLKTGTQIVPVFYHVKPDDVRYAKGVYAEAFSRHTEKGRYTLKKLQEWKNALNNVSYNVGSIVHNENDEGILMKKIVGSVSKVIKNLPFVVANHPIGLDKILIDFERTTLQATESHNNVQIVGIWGMGGSGKTTLAKQLYNNKYKYMDKSSFLLDVRDAASKNKLHKKQKKLLEDLGLKGVSIDNIEEGKGIIASRLRAIRVLIILDDVDNVEQLNALVPNKDNVGWGSLIIVTSREFEVLRCWGILSIYKMKALDRPHAKQLFCWHAFLQPSPNHVFEDLVEKFLNVCHGLPLSLKVFGAQLYGISNKDYWEIQLQKISRILPKDIKERLKVSYDALDEEEKQIFLDIACFFIGEKVASAIAAWDGSGWNGQHSWEGLLNKCLVELNDASDDESIEMQNHLLNDELIRMHDHLRDLGREIANQKSPYRLWSPHQIINAGHEGQGIAIRGIRSTAIEYISEEFLRLSHDGKLIIKASGVNYSLEPSSPGLKILHVRGNHYNQVIGDLSRELVWLRWHNIDERNLQALSSLKNLRVLELYGYRLDELWETDSNAPVQLRELVIDVFTGFPKSIGCLRHLKKIVIRIGNRVVESLPEEICLLQSLEYLELSSAGAARHGSCLRLSSLPSRFGDLRNLRHISLTHCWNLKSLPVSFKELTLLQYLSLDGCYSLTLESDILENMTKLEYLYIQGCWKLEELPRHITNQASLTKLHLSMESLRVLPVNIGQLSKLRMMEIENSKLLTSLPMSVGQLINLRKLRIRRCPISELDLGAGLFTCLMLIELENTEVSKISISEDCYLESLTLLYNGNLKKIEVLPNTLESIVLKGSPKLDVLPCFAQSTFLRVFELIGCYDVKKIQGLEHCRALEKLIAHTRWEEAGIESLEHMESLRRVELKAIGRSGVESCIQSMQLAWSCRSENGITSCNMGIPMELEGGKWVWTALLTQHSSFHQEISSKKQSRLHICQHGEGEVERGLLVMGEEDRVWEAFTRLYREMFGQRWEVAIWVLQRWNREQSGRGFGFNF